MITVALVNDFEVIVRGLEEIFEGHDDFAIRELDTRTDPEQRVDIAMIDTFSKEGDHVGSLRDLCHSGGFRHLVVFTWESDPEHVQQSLDAGAHGYLSKRLPVCELLDALRRVQAGEVVVLPGAKRTRDDEDLPVGDDGYAWPGKEHGLTYRESEVLCLITEGLTNEEIAARLFVSINSVKSYIRTAYRRMGVQRRSQAIRWAVEQGLYGRTVKER